MKFINIFFILIFIASALLQLNDPDTLTWFLIYLSGAVICFLAILKKDPSWLYYLFISLYLSYCIFLFFIKDGVLDWIIKYKMQSITGSMAADSLWIEHTREFFGLLILLFAAGINLIKNHKPLA